MFNNQSKFEEENIGMTKEGGGYFRPSYFFFFRVQQTLTRFRNGRYCMLLWRFHLA